MAKTRNERIKAEYRRLRKTGENAWLVGENAKLCLEDARVRIAFDDAARAGLVRLRFVPDSEPFDDSYIDTWTNETEETRERWRRELHDKIERDGVWGLVGEYRTLPLSDDSPCYPEDEEPGWEHGDGVWGFVGTEQNGYELGIMRQTLSMLRDALRSRCPSCRRPACA